MRWIISVVVVLALVAGLWWMEQKRQAELTPEPGVIVPEDQERPEPRYPLPKPEPQPAPEAGKPALDEDQETSDERPRPEPEPPLPDLADSDAAVLEALSGLLGGVFVQQWIRAEFVIPRTVAVINSLDGRAPALKTRPFNTMESEPSPEEIENSDALSWTEANAGRYDPLIAALKAAPPEEAAALYIRYYPLFQKSWDELGEPEPYFNDRLISIIDHLLATPEVTYPFEVVPREGRLHFADESLQQLSWGRKLIIRMGPEHRKFVSDWLEGFRQAATGTPDITMPEPDPAP